MKAQFCFLLFILSACTLSAQVNWQGGAPGHETDWNFACNWSDNRIPDDFDNVVIPDCSARGNFYPVIDTRNARVQSLLVYSGARLTITKHAKLMVLGYGLPGGSLDNFGTLENHGTLEVIEPVMHDIKYAGNGILIHTKSNIDPDVCEVQCH